MPLVPEAVERLAAEFGRLPGIGPKTAQRLTFYCLRASPDMSQRLAGALNDLHARVHPVHAVLLHRGRSALRHVHGCEA